MIPGARRRVPFLRKVKWLGDRPAALTAGLVFGIAPLVTILPIALLLWLHAWPCANYRAITKDGQTAPGQIVEVGADESTSVNGSNPHVLHYSFTVGGQTRTGTMKTMDSAAAGMTPGQAVTVRYLDDQSMIDGMEPYEFPFWIFAILIVPDVVVGIPLLAYVALGARRKARLYATGMVRKAQVVTLENTGGWPLYATGTRFRITYSFKDDIGKETFGTAITRDLTLARERHKGDEILILCLPEDNRVNCLAEDAVLAECGGA